MKTRDYWNENLDTDNLSRRGGESHPDLDEAFAFAATPEFEWLRRRVGDVEGSLVIDIGGGIGMHALLWAQAGARVVVVDLALRRLAALRTIAQNAGLADRIDFVVGSAESIPLSADSADVIFTKSVLIHTNLPSAAREIHRVLRPGGHGAFIEPLNRNPIIRLYRRLLAPKIWRSITRYFDDESLRELRQPFGRLRWKQFYLLSAGSFFWQYGMKRLIPFRKSLRRWGRVDAWLMNHWPTLSEWCWFAAIEVEKPGS